MSKDEKFSTSSSKISEDEKAESKDNKMTIKRLLSSKEFRILLSINFLCAYAGVAYYDGALPFVCVNLYKMKVQTVAILFSATGIMFLLMLIFVLGRISLQNDEIYTV